MSEAYFMSNLTLACLLFATGALGLLIRRNAISMFMCVELMLNAANLAILNFAKSGGWMIDGGLLVLFIIAIAAAEAGVGLAIIIKVFNDNAHVDAERLEELQG